jgi:alpha-L-fucosidase 2
MLPHAVDDRGHVVGTFWAGTIDHACTAWMAQLAWLHYRYTLEEDILREVAWPLLNGAFNGYWGMLEEVAAPDGSKRFSLPVSVSPEYNASAMDAWGRDASFQLAALHMIAGILPRAARALGEPEDPRWTQVRERLPPYTLIARSAIPHVEEGPHIGLWQGQDLDVSHRHHSHLAAIFPFRTVDPFDPAHEAVVRQSLRHWLRAGSGWQSSRL